MTRPNVRTFFQEEEEEEEEEIEAQSRFELQLGIPKCRIQPTSKNSSPVPEQIPPPPPKI